MVSNKDKTDITINILDGYQCRSIQSISNLNSQDELYKAVLLLVGRYIVEMIEGIKALFDEQKDC